MNEEEQPLDLDLKNHPLVVELRPSKKRKVLSDLASYKVFLQGELDFWKPLLDQSVRPSNPFMASLRAAESGLQDALGPRATTTAYRLKQLAASCQQLQALPIYSETTEGRFVGELLKTSVDRALGALALLLPETMGSVIARSNSETLRGFNEAFFRFAASPERRSRSVREDLERNQAELELGFGELQDQLLSISSELRDTANTVRTEFEAQSSDMSGHRDRWAEQFETLHRTSQERFHELETLYSEKLRLQGPATYWKSLATRYRTSGILWSIVSGALVVAGSVAGILGLDFFQKALQAAQSTVPGTTSTDWSHILPVTVVFAVIISVWVFAVRTTIRLALSGFHLVRDAVEREQLSHYYLALMAENKTLDKDAQTIVLQSLFSRAETGLLKGESGPTMPGNVAEILKNLRG